MGNFTGRFVIVVYGEYNCTKYCNIYFAVTGVTTMLTTSIDQQ